MDVFFGRESVIDSMVDLLGRERFLAVTGLSGTGKSSLVRAGLLDALELGLLASAGSRWTIVDIHPGANPIGELARGLLTKLTDIAPDAESVALLEASLARGPNEILRFANTHLGAAHGNLLILVDQFEELFRIRANRSFDRDQAFVDILLNACAQRELPIYIVITMRSEYFGDCAQFDGLPEAINRGHFLTPLMPRDGVAAAIESPAAVFAATISPELVNELVNAIGRQQDQLPLMQHAMQRMWRRVSERGTGEMRIGAEDVSAIGSIDTALSAHATEVLSRLDEQDRDVCRKVFQCLTELTPENRDGRRPTRLAEILSVTGAPLDQVTRILDAFRAAEVGFLAPGPEQPLTDNTVVDISHEALIRKWEQLQQWAREEREAAVIARRIAERCADKDGDLLRKGDLRRTREWRRNWQPTAGWCARYGVDLSIVDEFIRQSVAEEARVARREANVKLGAFGSIVLVIALGSYLGWQNWSQRVQKEDSARAQKQARELDDRARALNETQARVDREIRTIERLLWRGDTKQAAQNAMQQLDYASSSIAESIPDVAPAALRKQALSHYPTLRTTFGLISTWVPAVQRSQVEGIAPGGLDVCGASVVVAATHDGPINAWAQNVSVYPAQFVVPDALRDSHCSLPATRLRCATDGPWMVSAHPGGICLWNTQTLQLASSKALSGSPRIYESGTDGVLAGSPSHLRSYRIQGGRLVDNGNSTIPASISATDIAASNGTWIVKSRPTSGAGTPSVADTAVLLETTRAPPAVQASHTFDGPEGRKFVREIGVLEVSSSGRYAIAGSHGNQAVLFSRSSNCPAAEADTSIAVQAAGPATEVVQSPALESSPSDTVTAPTACWQKVAPLAHSDSVIHAVISESAGILATGSADGLVRSWRLPGGEPAAVLGGTNGDVTSLAMNDAGPEVAAASEDGTVRIWDATTSQLLDSLPQRGNPLRELHIVRGERLSVVGLDETGRVVQWFPASSGALATATAKLRIWKIRFSPSADVVQLVAASDDGRVHVWNLVGSELVEATGFAGHAGGVTSLSAFRPADSSWISGAYDGSLLAWRTDTNSLETLIAGDWSRDRRIRGVAVSSDATAGVVWGRGVVRYWAGDAADRVPGLRVPGAIGSENEQFRVGAISPDGKYVAVASDDSGLYLWSRDADNELALAAIDLATSRPALALIRALAFSDAGNLAIGDKSGRVRVLRPSADGRKFSEVGKIALYERHHGSISRVAWAASPACGDGDSSVLFTASTDKSIAIWSGTSYALCRALELHMGPVTDFALDRDGTRLASVGVDGIVILWDVVSGERIARFAPRSALTSVDFHPGGDYVAAGAADGNVFLFKTPPHDDELIRSVEQLSAGQ